MKNCQPSVLSWFTSRHGPGRGVHLRRNLLISMSGMLSAWGTSAWCQPVRISPTFQFTPAVINSAAPPDHVLFTMKKAVPFTLPPESPSLPRVGSSVGTFTSLTLDLVSHGNTIALNDAGQDGDLVAGDGVYSARVPTAPLLANLRADDANRVFTGYLNIYNGEQSLRTNIFIDVLTPNIARPAVVQVAPHIQATPHLVNMVMPSYFAGAANVGDITKDFYRWFRDDYDFINVVYLPARFENAFHVPTRNDISGLGKASLIRNNNALYGSLSRLQGVSEFAIPTLFDGANTRMVHETAHQWLSYLNFTPLLDQGLPHWPLSTMATGVMGFSTGPDKQGSTFDCDVQEQDGKVVLKPMPGAAVFNDLDLYLMGLLGPESVRPQLIFNDQADAANLNGKCTGQTYTGAMTRLTVQEVIQNAGPRVPSVAASPVRFRVATILVTRDALAAPETMWLYDTMAARAEGRQPTPVHDGFVRQIGMPFYVATRGLASLNMRIGINEPYTLEGRPYGPLSARSLTVTLRPEAGDVGQARQLFVAALVNGQLYFQTPTGWSFWQGGAIPAYATKTVSAMETFTVLDGKSNPSSLAGSLIFAGYGKDATEMLAAGRFALVHTLE